MAALAASSGDFVCDPVLKERADNIIHDRLVRENMVRSRVFSEGSYDKEMDMRERTCFKKVDIETAPAVEAARRYLDMFERANNFDSAANTVDSFMFLTS